MFDDKLWKLTLPIKGDGKNPKEVRAPFEEIEGVVEIPSPGEFILYCPVDGYTTPGSTYARTEFRELNPDGGLAAWSNKTGVHSLEYTATILETPDKKPQVVVGQIHDSSDDVFFIRYTRNKPTTGFIEVCHDSKKYGVLDDALPLGTEFKIDVITSAALTTIYYSTATHDHTVKIPKLKCRKSYFKVGNYIQSNKKTDPSGGRSVVKLHSIEIKHV